MEATEAKSPRVEVLPQRVAVAQSTKQVVIFATKLLMAGRVTLAVVNSFEKRFT